LAFDVVGEVIDMSQPIKVGRYIFGKSKGLLLPPTARIVSIRKLADVLDEKGNLIDEEYEVITIEA
jgi:hypothetical protein